LDLASIHRFDLTQKQISFVVLGVMVLYIGITSLELFEPECTGYLQCFDFDRRMARLYVWDVDWFKDDFRHFTHFALLTISDQFFGNYKVLVLVSSVLLLLLVYFLAESISGKRIGGLAAMLVMFQSTVFTNYDTSVAYPTFWALLFLTSWYLTRTKYWWLFVIPFVFAVAAKGIAAIFLPAIVLFVLASDTKNKKKIVLTLIVILIVGLVLVLSVEQFGNPTMGGYSVLKFFKGDQFVMGFVSWIWKGFADDQITIVLFMFAASILLSKAIRNGKATTLFCLGIIFVSPILTGLTTYDIWPYRMVPMVAGIAIMIAVVISNTDKWLEKFVPFLSKGSKGSTKEYEYQK